MYQASGTIKLIEDLQTFPSGFTKREFVLTIPDGKFSQDVKFETLKDKTSLLDGLNEEQEVTVSFDLRGNEFKGKYYVNLVCWKIEGGAGGGGSSKKQPAGDDSLDNEPEPDPADLRGADDDDDIPF